MAALGCSQASPAGGTGGTASGGAGTGGRTGSGGVPGSGGGTPMSSGGTTGSGGSSSSGGAGGSGGAVDGGGAAGSGGGGGSGGNASGGSGGAGGASVGTGGVGTGGAAGGGTAGLVVIPRAGRCAPPAGAKTADAQAAYAKWKADLLWTDGANGFVRVRRPNSMAEINSTVSEGIGYGMLAAVYMDDQPTFDGLWQYSQHWLDANGLMNWYINAAGTALGANGQGAASDADEDMAFALLIADKRWGGGGSLPAGQTYHAAALRQIGLIWQFEVDHGRNNVLTPGDQFAGGAVINISYFAPAFYRAFGRATSKQADWNGVVEATYTVLASTLNAQNGNSTNGLVPAWSTPAGVPQTPPNTTMPLYHQLDSCRTPFRLAQDYCWNGEPRALDYLKKIDSFYSTVGAANIVDGYDLNGTPHPQSASAGNQAAAFTGPAAVGAMAAAPAYATLRDQAYAGVATLSQVAGSQYYNESWAVLSLLMMTGLMDDVTQP